MPNIVEYTNRENITPTDRGTEAFAQQGRRIGAAFNQVAESMRDFGNRTAQNLKGAIADAGDAAVAWQDQRQVHQGAQFGAQLFNDLQNEKDDLIKGIDPNDPAYSSKVDVALQKWKQDSLEPRLEQFSSGFTTEKSKAWAEHFIDTTRQHFYTTAAADTATAAGLGVKNGAQNSLTVLSNVVTQDPTALKASMDLWEHSVGGLVGTATGLKGTKAGEVQSTMVDAGHRKLVQDAATSAIQKSVDPEATAQQWIKDWPQFINGDEALKFARAAKTVAKTNDLTDKQAAAFKRQQDDDVVKQKSADIMDKNVSVDGATGKVTMKPQYFKDALDLVRQHPDAPNAAATAQALINWGQHQQSARRETVVSDPAVRDDLYTRIFSADNPTSDVDIFKAETQDKLDRYDAQNLLNLRKAVEDKPLTGPVWKDTIESVKGMLGTDPNGHEAFGKFVSAFIPEYQRMSRAGTLPPNALDLRDPNSLISQVMAPYRREPQQMFIDRISHGLIAPGDIGNLPQGTPPARTAAPPKPVKSTEDAQKLNPGTRYITPDGKIYIR